MCFRISRDPDGFWDWYHEGPCGSADIASVDCWHITFFPDVTKEEMERAFTLQLVGARLNNLKHDLPIGYCVHLPASENLEKEYFVHQPPCNRSGDIGIVDQERHISFRPEVTKEQLEYGLTVAQHIFAGWPIVMTDFPEYHEEKN